MLWKGLCLILKIMMNILKQHLRVSLWSTLANLSDPAASGREAMRQLDTSPPPCRSANDAKRCVPRNVKKIIYSIIVHLIFENFDEIRRSINIHNK